jgi:anti-sigma-K factor RskA
MTLVTRDRRWEMLEIIGDYAAGELEAEKAREAEQLILKDPQALKLIESYLRMLVLLTTIGNESPKTPQGTIDHALQRVYLFAFLRQAEEFVSGLAGNYLGALALYLNLRPATG